MLGKKTGQSETKRAGRKRLDTLSAAPKLHDVRMVLVEAQRNKGMMCELPVRTATGVVFVLSCQSDHLSPEPCWTLYEGMDGSKQVWSYMNEDLQMITDILNMSISETTGSGGDVSSAFSDVKSALQSELAQAAEMKPWGAAAGPQQSNWGQAEAAPQNQPWPDPNQPQQPLGFPAPAPAPQQQMPQQQMPQQQMPQQQWPQGDPMQQMQQQQWPQADPMQQMQQQQWQQQQQMPPQQMPPQQWQQQQAPQQPYPQQPGGYGDPMQAQQPNDWPAPAATPPQSVNPWKNQQASASPATNTAAMTRFINMLDSKKNLTVGELLFAPDLPPACADSAMRLQEMVCKSELSDKQAVDALRLAAQKGTGVVDESVLGEIRQRANVSAESGRAAAQLLKDSGIITEADLNAAELKAESEGKDVAEVLIASGKSDKLMVEGALRCVALINDAKIGSGQAIIALNYCMRARAPIEQAFEDCSISIL